MPSEPVINITSSYYSLGEKELLQLHKTAFLCSRKVPASVILKCFDWAIAQRDAGNCVISGFHSKIEKDVLHFLLKGTQPIILVLARGLKSKVEPEFRKPLQDGRLLIISPFEKDITKITQETASIRNQLMVELADTITVGYSQKGGLVEKCLLGIGKEISYLAI